jgi:hypothetical protein
MTVENALFERYACSPICRVTLVVRAMTAAIGPTGDDLYLPLRIDGGIVAGAGADLNVLGGSDFAVMHADEMLEHHGMLVAADPAGEVIFWYDGASRAPEGAYDDVIDGRLPDSVSCVLSVRIRSTNVRWRALNRLPLLGAGTFAGGSASLDFTVLKATRER